MVNFVIHISEDEMEYLHKQGRKARIKIESYISNLIKEDMLNNEDDDEVVGKYLNPSWEVRMKREYGNGKKEV